MSDHDRTAAERLGAWWELDRERADQPEGNLHGGPDPETLPWADEDDTKGWNRLSINRTAPRPGLQAGELIMPSGMGSPRMLWMCFLMALIMTVLWVWFPLYLVSFFVGISGRVYAGVMTGSPILATLLLYLCGGRETKRDRQLAARL